jgi:hypothetical protein
MEARLLIEDRERRIVCMLALSPSSEDDEESDSERIRAETRRLTTGFGIPELGVGEEDGSWLRNN